MELLSIIVVLCCAIFILKYSWKVLNWVWIRPKKHEKWLRKQGLKGTTYKLLFGDFKELGKMLREATSNPINLSDDIVPRALPFFLQATQEYGKTCLVWLGPKATVVVMDPELVKEVFIKYNLFHKPPSNPLTKLLANGLASLEDEKWVKHRKIINPAFHFEKLKITLSEQGKGS